MDEELEKIRSRKIKELMKKMDKKESRITVYSTQTCPYCYMAKDYLKAKGIPYRDVDVGADRKAAQEMVSKSGQMGVPVLDIGGEIIVGFDREKIDAQIAKMKPREEPSRQ